MSRQLEQAREIQQEKLDRRLVSALEFELVGAVGHAGGQLTGFSVRYGELDVLLTLRALIGSKQQIAFVGAETLPGAFRKAVWEAHRDNLRWKADAYEQTQD